MRNPFIKPYRFAITCALVLSLASGMVLLDAFVIPRSLATVQAAPLTQSTEQVVQSTTEPIITDTSYEDDQIKITIETLYAYDTTIYIADIQVSDVSYLKTALAGNTYGRNIKETTSDIASAHDAILAINGDYYGFRDSGYVLRNGVLYRSTANGDALMIDDEGNLSILDADTATVADWLEDNAWQVFSFGPTLLVDGQISVTAKSEVDQSMQSNPRTAIGQIAPLHYIMVVSDGRTNESEGLSLLQLATVLEQKGCTIAYNLDGGGSSTMVFMGEVLNTPTNGRSASERKVSDIVYIGYQ